MFVILLSSSNVVQGADKSLVRLVSDVVGWTRKCRWELIYCPDQIMYACCRLSRTFRGMKCHVYVYMYMYIYVRGKDLSAPLYFDLGFNYSRLHLF